MRFLDADESGSLTTGDTEITEYVWDHRNRLVGVDSFDDFDDYDDYIPGTNDTRSQTVDYAYDYLNRMISRTVDADGAGTTHSPATEYFVYDHDASTNWALKDLSTSEEGTIPFGANPATDAGQIVLQLDESGSPTHRYLWGPAVDMLLADEAVDDGGAEDVAWTLTDHQNSVRDIVVLDDNGTPGNPADDQWIVENHITYRAFGEKAAETGAVDCVFGFTGRYLDSLTDDQYNHQRWYKPATGNWQSEDPIGFEGGDANLYRYCGNDPVNWVDPSGLLDGPGHHPVPGETWPEWIDRDIARSVWDQEADRIRQPAVEGVNTGHGRFAHGPKTGYSAEVRKLMDQEFAAYKKANNITGRLSREAQEDFARKFLDTVKNQPLDTYIGGFNDAVRKGGDDAVRMWKRVWDRSESAKTLLRKSRVLRKVAGAAPAFIGVVISVWFFPDKVDAKGLPGAVLDETLDWIPVIEQKKALDELVTGKDYIRDKGQKGELERIPLQYILTH